MQIPNADPAYKIVNILLKKKKKKLFRLGKDMHSEHFLSSELISTFVW